MKFTIKLISLLLLTLLLSSLALAEEQSLENYAARAAAEYFLVMLDEGQYDKCWDEASELFRTSSVKLQWQERIEHLREQYRELKDRQLRFSKEMHDVEGAPKGDYFFIIYGSSFAGRASVIETVTVMNDNSGKWRVSGYSIK